MRGWGPETGASWGEELTGGLWQSRCLMGPKQATSAIQHCACLGVAGQRPEAEDWRGQVHWWPLSSPANLGFYVQLVSDGIGSPISGIRACVCVYLSIGTQCMLFCLLCWFPCREEDHASVHRKDELACSCEPDKGLPCLFKAQQRSMTSGMLKMMQQTQLHFLWLIWDREIYEPWTCPYSAWSSYRRWNESTAFGNPEE